MEAEGFKLDIDERRENSAEPAEQGAEAAGMDEPTAASSNSNEEKLPSAHSSNSSSAKQGGKGDILLLSDDSHKSAVSNKSSSGSGHRTRGEPSSSSSGAGSRYSSGDKYMSLDDLDKGHSPKAPSTSARGGELEEEEPTDLSYEQWAMGDQVR